MLNVEIAVAKAAKYAVHESGDSVEVIERPRGGLSVVMADGQRSGHSAKAISNIAVRKAMSLLAEGVRDGAVARAAHDYLRTQRRGQVSAELTIVSVDLETRTLVISRNSQCPVLLSEGDAWRAIDDPSETVGIRERTRPVIVELPLAAGQTAIAFTDGVLHAGERRGHCIDPLQIAQSQGCQPVCSAQRLADGLLAAALVADDGRPGDDVTVVVLQVTERFDESEPEVRRMTVSFPVPPI
ncbi:MAG: serine/threonine-protein phosphatase [Anaerolineae bacterium]|nr:serine/threonine-protein phosphatase [Anaerolineae bacterium]